jgi:hypothetical protein
LGEAHVGVHVDHGHGVARLVGDVCPGAVGL